MDNVDFHVDSHMVQLPQQISVKKWHTEQLLEVIWQLRLCDRKQKHQIFVQN